jgi:predicted nucleic acid-binding protein
VDPAGTIEAMTPVAVVDASALAAIAFNEPEAGEVVRRLENRELVAPRLLVYELANTAWRKARKHPDRAAAIRAGLQRALADDMAIVWSDVEPDAVLDLALEMDLTAYDASYLWLARHLQAELVTLDRALAAAADSL